MATFVLQTSALLKGFKPIFYSFCKQTYYCLANRSLNTFENPKKVRLTKQKMEAVMLMRVPPLGALPQKKKNKNVFVFNFNILLWKILFTRNFVIQLFYRQY